MMIHTHKKQQQQTFYFQSSCGRLEIIKPNTWHPILKKNIPGHENKQLDCLCGC